MRFEALKADHGDCLILTFAGPSRTHRLVVDGGPTKQTGKTLMAQLDISRAGLARTESLPIDAILISHIDNDHVIGINALLQVLGDREGNRQPWPWRPRWLLHNSFDDLVGEGLGGAARVVGGETILANLGGGLPLPGMGEVGEDLLKILAGYRDGSKLSSLAAGLRIPRNPPDQGVLACDPAAPQVFRMGDARLTIVGPLRPQVERLQTEWARWKAGEDPKTSFPVKGFPKNMDRSITNLSSIVALIEDGPHSVLLTGDALGSQVVEGLAALGRLDATSRMGVDILKLPHHGSSRNIDKALLGAVRARHYVVSGDGHHGNPDRASLELMEKLCTHGCTLHLTYSAAHCDARHAEYARDHSRPFDLATEGIEPVIARWRAQGSPITVIEESPGIDL